MYTKIAVGATIIIMYLIRLELKIWRLEKMPDLIRISALVGAIIGLFSHGIEGTIGRAIIGAVLV